MFNPRPKQQAVVDYTGGKMGVSAVPGSGKTHILAYLVADLIARGAVLPDQEILVVTLVNSAVDHFSHRVAQFMKAKGLVPQMGYRVRTLHGLAHDILRERPALAGLSDDFQILDERATEEMLASISQAWLDHHPSSSHNFLHPDLNESSLRQVHKKAWPELVKGMTANLIRQCKDCQMTASDLGERLDHIAEPLPLLEMVHDIYADYEQALGNRGAIDFDDLIVKALQALRSDIDFVKRLRNKWPFILEDEAQDSSRLQEEILRMLSGEGGNWVRVGDPNQAIFETFTTASPQYLRDFVLERDVISRELTNSGRSTQSIIDLANGLIDWTNHDHPQMTLRGSLTPPHIEPTPTGDPQKNPPDEPKGIQIIDYLYTPAEELEVVVRSLERWLPENQDQTVAVLVPTNQRGFHLVNVLKKRNIPTYEILRSTRETRETAQSLATVMQFLAEPHSPRHLEQAYLTWVGADVAPQPTDDTVEQAKQLLQKCRWVEDYIWPTSGNDWIDHLDLDQGSELQQTLRRFREVVRNWLDASQLPINQLLITLAQDLFIEPADLALTHKLASVLRQLSTYNPNWRLPELTTELEIVARNERRFIGLSQADIGFDPDQHPGEVVVATMHKAKGLEWDRVYIMSVNNYDFPSGYPEDGYIAEKWFIRDRLNLEAEALRQFQILVLEEALDLPLDGIATEQARLDYAGERMRLLYVGITRARRDLILTLNSGRDKDKKPSVPLLALKSSLETKNNDSTF
jgi:DNA helicase-2/ATP-dependent DNA helicase PcrA